MGQRIISDIQADDGKSQFNVARLLRPIDELNDNYEQRNSYAAHALLRAILDHIPPILGQPDFNAVANNHSWGSHIFMIAKTLVPQEVPDPS